MSLDRSVLDISIKKMALDRPNDINHSVTYAPKLEDRGTIPN